MYLLPWRGWVWGHLDFFLSIVPCIHRFTCIYDVVGSFMKLDVTSDMVDL